MLIAIALLMLSSCSTLTCGGLRDMNAVYARDAINNRKISMRISVKNAHRGGNETSFGLDKDIHELAHMITEQYPSWSPKIHQDKFISVTTEVMVFLIAQVEKDDADKDNENRYILFAPTGTFEVPGEGYPTASISAHIPYHLIEAVETPYYHFSPKYADKMECEAYGSMDDFMDFYSKIEQCEVEKQNDSLIVTNKKSEYKVMLTFSQNEDMLKVTFSLQS